MNSGLIVVIMIVMLIVVSLFCYKVRENVDRRAEESVHQALAGEDNIV